MEFAKLKDGHRHKGKTNRSRGGDMVEGIFGFLNSIGFTHPLHPALTHIPMGMVMGAVTFRMLSLHSRLRFLAKTGYHCVVLGFLGIFPTVFAGYLDWQHTFSGIWNFLIVLKMFLAFALTVLLAVIIIKDEPEIPGFDKNILFYILSIALAIGLGFSGGELQYG